MYLNGQPIMTRLSLVIESNLARIFRYLQNMNNDSLQKSEEACLHETTHENIVLKDIHIMMSLRKYYLHQKVGS